MLPNLTEPEIAELRAMLAERLRGGGSTVPTPTPPITRPLQLVRFRGAWSESRRTDDGGETGIAPAELLLPGDDDEDDPSKPQATGNRVAITNIIAPATICLAYDAALLARLPQGVTFATMGMANNYDNGEQLAINVTTDAAPPAATEIRIELARNLLGPTFNAGSEIGLAGAWGRSLSRRILTAVSHARHDVGVVARVGGEYVQLCRGQCRGMLIDALAAAGVSGADIVPTYATMMPGELDASGHFVPCVDPVTGLKTTLRVRNLDEHLSVAAHTLVYAIQFGDAWEVLAACSSSATTRSEWELS